MAERSAAVLAAPLVDLLPPVDFCCAYGSSLLPNNHDHTSMVDYILGVADPVQWHSENLERNRKHYSKWMAHLGPEMITRVADGVGAGVHFNPFVEWRDKMIKYGVVRMHDLAMDVLTWDRFYLSGRLQKPVRVLIDNWEIRKVNVINLKSATSASLLLLPPEFTEEDLYSKICGLSYMGDLRMLFAEDKNKVKKIVQGSFNLFQSMYRPLLREYASDGLLKMSSLGQQQSFKQECGSSATNYLVSMLPATIQRQIGGKCRVDETGIITPQIIVSSKEEAANCVRKALRRIVMVSSVRQAVSGVLAAGGVNAARYLGKKISKAWTSRTS
ncbi:phosphatidate cytidylyltransferase, mitochondrial isoform X2 [Ananas comosus]|uniref:Phosphatidate cytidylyltransferase, mitochondrial n=1 Tax=Ananas comosus TaxID=4615 RepID=A0A6P5FY03_ANACO|nr:phosphatidate cytidylyltransferase, mitochondrial isoform X2 [Ananas comosus]